MLLISPTGPKVTSKSERKAKKRERKKNEHFYIFISSTLEVVFERQKKFAISESYSLASRDGQRKALPRAEVTSIVFINLGRYRTAE